jgi:hypothetical protein
MARGVNLTQEQHISRVAYDEVERAADLVEPRAVAVHFDPEQQTVRFDLRSGASVTLPVSLIPMDVPDGTDLDASFRAAAVDKRGEYVWLGDIGEGITVPGTILHALFGREVWRYWSEGWGQKVQAAEARIRSELARKAGSTKSVAKSAAARANGTKGGRPRKLPPAAGE